MAMLPMRLIPKGEMVEGAQGMSVMSHEMVPEIPTRGAVLKTPPRGTVHGNLRRIRKTRGPNVRLVLTELRGLRGCRMLSFPREL